MADSLELALDDRRGRVRIGRPAIRRLDVSRGRGTGAGKGALIGGVIGIGAGVAFALTHPPSEVGTSELLAAGATGFGVLGGALGFFFGSFATVEKWGPGSLSLGRNSNETSRRRGGIQFTLRFQLAQ